MSEPTREEKIRTIKAARQVMQNLMEQHAPLIREYAEMMNQRKELFRPRNPKPQPPAAQEDPAEQAAMQALLAEIKNSQGEKK
jgi:hypothetical protein